MCRFAKHKQWLDLELQSKEDSVKQTMDGSCFLTGTTPLCRRDLESNKEFKTYVVQMLSSQVQ